MISGCLYQKLESLLPPLVPTNTHNIRQENRSTGILKIENHDFTRLEHISACVIMHDEDIAQRLLPFTPAKLFKPLLQAAVFNNFYKDGRRLKLPGSLVQLILHWPYENFILNEILPSLPPPNFSRLSQLELINRDLNFFFEELVYLLPQEFLRSKSDFASNEEWKFSTSWQKLTYKNPSNFGRCLNSQLKKIDVSGFNHQNSTEGILTPKYLLGSVKAAYDPNCHPGYDKLELICDAYIDASDKDNLHALGIIAEISSHHGAKLKVVFRKVLITSLQNNQIASLLKILYKNGTEFLELALSDVDDEITTCFYPQLQGLSISHSTKITSLAFLNNMSNLKQLNLSGMRLRNKLTPLCNLQNGLTFLKLVGCGLKGEDMKVLEQSHHPKTLLHLDISDNSFSLPGDASGLIEFCQKLVSVVILEMEDCSLDKLISDLLGILLETLSTLPKLSLLCLNQNDFSSRLLCTHIKVLHTCMSLRCVSLTVPSDMYVSDDFNIIQNRIQDLQYKIDSEINYKRKSVLNVIWKEDMYYSRWFYTIQ